MWPEVTGWVTVRGGAGAGLGAPEGLGDVVGGLPEPGADVALALAETEPAVLAGDDRPPLGIDRFPEGRGFAAFDPDPGAVDRPSAIVAGARIALPVETRETR
ncbi:MAG: hypothetical protein NVS3B18_15840 [Candidatus Dormibacteria bacterium]